MTIEELRSKEFFCGIWDIPAGKQVEIFVHKDSTGDALVAYSHEIREFVDQGFYRAPVIDDFRNYSRYTLKIKGSMEAEAVAKKVMASLEAARIRWATREYFMYEPTGLVRVTRTIDKSAVVKETEEDKEIRVWL